jgi:hypothetical protein
MTGYGMINDDELQRIENELGFLSPSGVQHIMISKCRVWQLINTVKALKHKLEKYEKEKKDENRV